MPAVPIVDRLADAEAVRARLQRMFPRYQVSVEPYDYGHAATFMIEDKRRAFGTNISLSFSDSQGDARRVGARFLRAAFPIGWATP